MKLTTLNVNTRHNIQKRSEVVNENNQMSLKDTEYTKYVDKK